MPEKGIRACSKCFYRGCKAYRKINNITQPLLILCGNCGHMRYTRAKLYNHEVKEISSYELWKLRREIKERRESA